VPRFTAVSRAYKVVSLVVAIAVSIALLFQWPAIMKYTSTIVCTLLVSITLSACGGGGGDSAEVAEAPDVALSAGAAEPRAQVQVVRDVAEASVVKPNSVEVSSTKWGTAERPFSARSPWNARPINPVFTDIGIPQDVYFPKIESGKFSTGVFVASANDAAVEVLGPIGKRGVWDPDGQVHLPKIVIPRWPSNTVPAESGDGHADIVDPISGVVHSFWQLRQIDGVWRAEQYAWTRLDGRGWSDPAHWFQGARAAAVPTMGGLIRTSAINDGDTMFRHALAMSLAHSGLSPSPTYVFPATSADTGAEVTNFGRVPEGALLMLPANFDTSKITSPILKKIAETLKVYGAYAVDRNHGTPFVIYAEIGSGINLHPNGWNSKNANDLNDIRAALRVVESAEQWLDGDGRPFDMTGEKLNLLSMRGPWRLVSGNTLGVFNTLSQRVEFENPGNARIVQRNTTGTGFNKVTWGRLQPGVRYTIKAETTGGAKLRLRLVNMEDPSKTMDTGELANGESFTFTWPTLVSWHELVAISGTNQVSSVGVLLTRAE